MIIKNISKQVRISKKGTPYASVAIQLEEYQENGKMVWIKGFGNKRTWAWKKGDDVQPEITKEGKYYNFTFADTEENRLDVYSLPATVGTVIELLKAGQPSTPTTPEKKKL